MLHVCKKVNTIFKDIKDEKFKPILFQKGKNDKFTSADWIIQKMLENYLHKYFPKLDIVGEEDTTNDNGIISDYTQIDEEIDFDLGFIKVSEEYKELPIEDLCIFVDPIDSTSQFIKGNYEPVTTLIGLTLKGSPLFGIVHFPSYKNKDPLCYLNLPGNGVYEYDFNSEPKQIVPTPCTSWNFISSSSRTSKEMINSK
jgi:3'-phosphoadenosine 5'-phosphosulfate (PAPS) 3'-phosphatase